VDSLSPIWLDAWMTIDSDDQYKLEFGKRLRVVRIAHGMSQEGLALACGLDRSYIGGVERGERNISVVNIFKLANALNTSPKEFFE